MLLTFVHICSVVTGTGELDSSEEDTDPDVAQEPPICPYLLLDVRDKDDYDKCHIISGKMIVESCSCM